LKQLAAEKEVVQDVLASNGREMDETALQEAWAGGSGRSSLVRSYQQRPSSRVLKDYFFRTLPLVDCYLLDERGRIVGILHKTRDFLHDQEAVFVGGLQGDVFVQEVMPGLEGEPLEVALPIRDGERIVGVLVARVLTQK
jgi:hypothetical protein